MKRITIIDQVGSKAGMDYYSSSLAKGLLDQQCNCILCSNYTGIESDRIEYKPFFDGHNSKAPIFKLIKLLSAIFKSSYLSKKRNVDLVITHLFTANLSSLLLALIPKLFGLKLVVISHDISSFDNNDKNLIQNIIYNKLSDFIVVHNNLSFSELMKTVDIKNKNKIKVIKHGGHLDYVDASMNRVKARKLLGFDEKDKYILFFGQIKDVKGLDILLESMVSVPQSVKLVIAGKPRNSDFSFYDNLISKYKLSDRVEKMIRFIEDDERERLFFAADVLILPYRSIYQSGVLLMAMSYGLPTIVSDLPANKEIINDGENGLLFRSEDSDNLALKINLFFEKKELASKISKEGLITIKNEYDWTNIAGHYTKIIST